MIYYCDSYISFFFRRNHGQSNYDDGGYAPRSCPHCKINNLGNGNNNRHTFNVPKEAFN